jgi:UrcA family protein
MSIDTLINRKALALCALFLLAGVAIAGPQDEAPTTRSVKVQYADLNLNSSAGVTALYKRIRAAARRACALDGHLQTFELRKKQQECQHVAVANAVDSLRNERLSAVHQRTGRRTG